MQTVRYMVSVIAKFDRIVNGRALEWFVSQHRLKLLGVLAVIATASRPALAQWPSYSSPAVPRLQNGQIALDAPAPRTSDGKPDLSGLWLPTRAQQPQRTPPIGEPPIATGVDVGANIKEGLPLRSWALDLLKKRTHENGKDYPEGLCLPMGIMRFHTNNAPRKIIQTPAVLVILYETNAGSRQIFTDGRSLPRNDPQPWWFGYSIGKWDGDTLVVETSGLRDDGWLDINGTPLTDAAKLTERFRRPTFGRMEIDITVDDPKAYTQPWTVRVNLGIMVDEELIEFVCLENQKFNPK
jgi:hypothetical protein